MDTVFFVGLLSLALIKATPLALGAMCGLLCERSGVINIGIEGMMLVGAMTSFLGSVIFNDITGGTLPKTVSLLVGLLVAMLSAGFIALLHAWLSIQYKVDQIISGTVINLLAVGITNFTANAYIDPNHLSGVGVFTEVEIPILSQIPIIGPILFQHQPLVYVMLILVGFLQYALFNTRWGLRTRAVGEHPRAADTVGINVNRTRYINVTLGGVLAGIGGAFLVLESVGRFQKLMTTGRGFIALAALIFGKWTSVGALLSGLLFGFSEALGVRLQLGDVNELQALILLGGIGVAVLGAVWVILKARRRQEDKRSMPLVVGTLVVGLAMVATALLATFPEVEIPIQFLGLLPYILTILVLTGFVGRAIPPAAIGRPYEKQ
ncbi:MAG: ABC transporter permease [Chloroflexi bacterium]|nr:ABC transporter permease [Chloroflexota bacterium]